jgi:stage II sporulation protein D
MRRPPRVRVPLATIVALLAACTSDVVPPEAGSSGERAQATVPSAPTPSAEATTPPETGEDGFEVSARQLQIEVPPGGSFHVRATYPWSPSECVRPDRPTLDARYPGALSVRVTDDGTMNVTVTIPFREYLEGIAEVPPTWPKAALEAQVIAARSYVLSRTGWAGEEGDPLGEPICATSDCQVYGGIPRPRPPGIERWYRAVRNTTGQVLISGGRPADTVYSSTSNGRTYANEDVFGGSPLPYLRPVIERHDGASPLSRWTTELPFGDLATVLRAAGSWPEDAPVSSATVDGSAIVVRGGGQMRTLDASTVRDAVNTWAPCLLPRRYPAGGLPVTIPSGWFSLSATPRSLVVDGRGWGHGVGMVQWGAYGKAVRGWSASRILSFYYRGLTPRSYPEPGSLQVVVATGVRSMTVDPSRRGATVGEHTLGPGVIRITGGDEVRVVAR